MLKDNVNTADMPTTAGSVALSGSIPLSDAFITQKLRAAGAIILGKATLTEFANFLTNGMPAGYSSLGGTVTTLTIRGPIRVRSRLATDARADAGRIEFGLRASRWQPISQLSVSAPRHRDRS